MSDEAHSFDCQDNCDGASRSHAPRGSTETSLHVALPSSTNRHEFRNPPKGARVPCLAGSSRWGDWPTRCRTLGWWIGEAAFASW